VVETLFDTEACVPDPQWEWFFALKHTMQRSTSPDLDTNKVIPDPAAPSLVTKTTKRLPKLKYLLKHD
jgi:hypothetical protein